MANIAVTILAKIGEPLVAPVGRQLGYLVKFNGNVATLKKEVEKLGDMKVGVQQEVDVAKRDVETIFNTVESWLSRVSTVEDEAQIIVEEKAQFPEGCLNGWCFNLKTRYILSRKAKKKTQEIVDLKKEGKFRGKVSCPPPPPIPVLASTSERTFHSRSSVFDEIIAMLKDDKINMIGICGMGGVGKTTMAKEVFDKVKEEMLFDDCVMTVISQKADFTKVQSDIADMLGLRLDEQNPITREAKLYQRLTNKRVLVILDDVWEEFELKILGINFQKGCKVLFTSRVQGLWLEVNAKRDFPLPVLTEDEAWDLFRSKVKDILEKKPELQQVAKEIVKECRGLPLALVTIAGALRGKSSYVWSDALRQLKLSYPPKVPGIYAKVYQSLKLSYNFLEDDDAKSLFLLCSLYEEDSVIPVEHLVMIALGLHLLPGINDLEQARDRVFTVIEQLVSRCLLLASKDFFYTKCIKMHDVVRDVAKSIASAERGALIVDHGVKLTVLQEQGSLNDLLWVSIISKEITELPIELRSPHVKLLICNNSAMQITDSSFEGMGELRVLHINGIDLPQLPSSIRLLSKLRTLYFQNCKLNNITAIRDLLKLECLSFVGSHIQDIPVEVGHLANLVSLDLTRCFSLRTIQPRVVSSIRKLQEIYIDSIDVDWETKASLSEFERLSSLHTLHIKIKNPSVLPKSPIFSNLKKYKFQIGYWDANVECERACLISLDTFFPLGGDIIYLSKNADELWLNGEFTEDQVHELVEWGSQRLKHLKFHNIDAINYLANPIDRTTTPLFLPMVESLSLSNLNNLQQMFHNPIMVGSFEKLKVVGVMNCKKLKNTFQLSVKTDLMNLERLEIYDCESMEEVIWKDREDNGANKLAFPKLLHISIENLPSLVSFCREVNEIEFPHLKKLWFKMIPLIECLFSGMSNHKILRGQLQNGSFRNLEWLGVVGCKGLRSVFTPFMAGYLVHLKHLRILDCSLLESVVAKEEDKYEKEISTLVPKLEEIILGQLPALQCFYHVAHDLELPMLDRASVYDCPELKTFSPGCVYTPKLNYVNIGTKAETLWVENLNSTIHHFHDQQLRLEGEFTEDQVHELVEKRSHRLKRLYLHNNHTIQQISQSVVGSIEKLEELEVIKCKELKNTFPLSVVRDLKHLKILTIKDCESMEEVIRKERQDDSTNKLAFPKLFNMTIDNLPSLVSFSKGINEIEFPHLRFLLFDEIPQIECPFSGSGNQSFFPQVSFPNLTQITLSNLVNMKEVWCGQLQNGSFRNLVYVFIIDCNKLRSVFTPYMARYLVHLDFLKIIGCSSLELVVAKEDEKDEIEISTLFPKLEEIFFSNLPALQSFCHVAHDLELSMLKDVHVIECPELKAFSPGCVRTPKLNYVKVGRKEETLWVDNLNRTIQLLHEQTDRYSTTST